jgi:hypothetical protein
VVAVGVAGGQGLGAGSAPSRWTGGTGGRVGGSGLVWSGLVVCRELLSVLFLSIQTEGGGSLPRLDSSQ